MRARMCIPHHARRYFNVFFCPASHGRPSLRRPGVGLRCCAQDAKERGIRCAGLQDAGGAWPVGSGSNCVWGHRESRADILVWLYTCFVAGWLGGDGDLDCCYAHHPVSRRREVRPPSRCGSCAQPTSLACRDNERNLNTVRRLPDCQHCPRESETSICHVLCRVPSTGARGRLGLACRGQCSLRGPGTSRTWTNR